MSTIDLIQSRDARRFRLLQAAAVLKLFREARGYHATSTAEVADFLRGARHARRIDPFAVLTREECEHALTRTA